MQLWFVPERVAPAVLAHGTPRREHTRAVIYRMRVYDAVPEHLETFHDVFRNHLLPVQLKHGARLVGRWETDDARVVAVWEYDDAAACARIEAAVRDDPESQWSQSRRGALPPLFRGYDEVFMRSTMPV